MNPPIKNKIKRLSLSEQELLIRFRWIIQLRWFAVCGIVTAIFVAEEIFGIRLRHTEIGIIALIIFIYNTLFNYYSTVIIKEPNPNIPFIRLLANLQIALDLFFLVLLIHFSGGIENPFLIYTLFHMSIASILLGGSFAYFQASFAALLINIMIFCEFYGFIPHYHLEGFFRIELYNIPLFAISVALAMTSALYLTVYMTASIVKTLRQREDKLGEVAVDLEEKNKLLLQTDEEKSNFMRLIQHELKSPVVAIHSYLSLIQEGYLGDVLTKEREIIDKAIIRAEEIIQILNDLLELAKLESPTVETQITSVDVWEIIKLCLDNFLVQIQAKNLTIEKNLESDNPIIPGEENNLYTAISNIINNAIKYSNPNQTVRIICRDNNQNLEIIISDEGIGIPENEIPKIFNEFYRATNVKASRIPGTGLGMNIVKKIVEKHKGKMEIQSALNKGTTITLSFPKQ